MIHEVNTIQTDRTGRQMRMQENYNFNFTAYESDVNRFIARCIPTHWHRELEIFRLLEGSVRIQFESTSYVLSAGDGCFINSGIIHSFTGAASVPCVYRSIVFDSDIVSGMPGSVFDVAYVKPLLQQGVPWMKFRSDESSPLCEMFDQIFEACVREDTGYEFLVRSLLSSILLHIRQSSGLLPSRVAENTQEKRIKLLMQWVENHLMEPITLQDIAEAASISPRECQRLFARYLHRSPIEYLQWKRILASADMLKEQDTPVIDIALSCGFSSPSYFSKKFKEYTGLTPREYRETSL